MSRFVAVIFALGTILACAAQAAMPTVQLYPGRSVDSVRNEIRFKQDTSGADEGAPNTDGMAPVAHRSIQFGQPGDTVVGALKVRNAGRTSGSWVLTTGRGLVDRFTLYREDAKGRRTLFDNRDTVALGSTLSTF